MAQTHAPSRDWRRITFYAVTLGAMAVSIGGQMETIAPRIGPLFAFIFAVVNDVGAILALDCAMTAAKKSAIQRWAWVAVLLATVSGGTLNAWHAIVGVPAPHPAHFPVVLGLVVGVEPILLVLVLSHILGMVVAAQREAAGAGGREVPAPAAADREVAARRSRETTASTASLTASSTASLVATTVAPGREIAPTRAASTASSRRAPAPERHPAPGPLPRLHVAPTPGSDRPDWMKKELLETVVALALAAGAPAKRYGEPRLKQELPTLPDGSRMTSHKAQELLRFIRDHDLLRAAS